MDDVSLAVELARAGGAVLTRHFDAGRSVDLKRRFDPVTEADRESEALIVEMLGTHRPDDAVLAEEGSGSDAPGRRWIVDPLDGTVNFVHRIPQISVSIALYEDDSPLVAVVYDPLRDELFVAESGRGATRNGDPMRVSGQSDPAQAVIGTGFPYDHDERAADYVAPIERMLRHVNGIRRFGSAALDLAWVAAGRLDGFWELALAPWDLAAGVLLVTEAGGTVTTPDGGAVVPSHTPLVASNGLLHPLMLELIDQ